MTIHWLNKDSIEQVEETSFPAEGIKERDDLQRILRDNIHVISPGTMIISEEFSRWTDSDCRIDLLGLDKDANIVVFELKRTKDGGYMDLQAIRYAAMVSNLTLDQVIDAHAEYLQKRNIQKDPKNQVMSFLEQGSPIGEYKINDVRVVLVSADFSKELTTAVMWLNEYDLDIRCIRLKPYNLDGKVLVDVQQIIPLPESTDYWVQLKEKEQSERSARSRQWDVSRDDWETRGSKEAMEIADACVAIMHEFNPALKLKLNKSYVGMADPNGANNFTYYMPKKEFLRVLPKVKNRLLWTEKLEKAGIVVINENTKDDRISFRLKKDEVAKHHDLLKELFLASYAEQQE
jgi:hypothetical protein